MEVKRLIVGMIRTNCYIAYDEKGNALIVDPAEESARIKNAISQLGVKPVGILLTHGHFDHIGAADILRKTYDIKIYAYEEEKDILNMQSFNLSSSFGMDITLDADVYLKDGQEFNIEEFDIKVIHTPGHTKGSCCYLIEDLLFSGDTLFSGTHGRTDFPTGSQSAIIRSIREKLLTLDGDIHVFPGHEEDTTIEEEKRYY